MAWYCCNHSACLLQKHWCDYLFILDLMKHVSEWMNVNGSGNCYPFNTLRPRQDGRHFPDDIFRCIFFNENCCILIRFSLRYVSKGPIDNKPALVQIMAWRRSGDKPLSEPMMISLPTHICVTRPQWVNDKPFPTPKVHFLWNGPL